MRNLRRVAVKQVEMGHNGPVVQLGHNVQVR